MLLNRYLRNAISVLPCWIQRCTQLNLNSPRSYVVNRHAPRSQTQYARLLPKAGHTLMLSQSETILCPQSHYVTERRPQGASPNSDVWTAGPTNHRTIPRSIRALWGGPD